MRGIHGAIWTEPSKAVEPYDRGTFRQTWESGGIALAGQSFTNGDASIRVVLDGTIYNADSLRRELVAKGHRFNSDGDAEVIAHLYEEEGSAMVQRLNGPFALAIWNERDHCLQIIRDRIGKKPLLYRIESDRFLFASELKNILAVPGVPREIDPTALDDYLTYQYVPHPKTIFRDIFKLPPGHFAVWQDGRLSISRYWNVDWNEEDNRLTAGEWSEQLQALVMDAVRIRMGGGVAVGAFLSGGVDSSIITGLVQQQSRLEYSRSIRTFSIGFEHKEYDESIFARQTAERLGTLHRELIVQPGMEDLLPQLVEHNDEPFADSSMIPTWYLCEMAKQDVDVALAGDGGDEMFAGYDRYKAVKLGRLAEKLPIFLRHLLAGPVRNLIPASTRQRSTPRRLKRFLEALDMAPLERYLQWIAIFNRQRRDELYTDDFRQTLRQPEWETDSGYDSLDFLRDSRNRCLGRDIVTQTSLIDIQTYLPGDVMTKVNVAATAHNLECRAPLLDYRIVELAARMPIRFKIQGGRGKMILRDTFHALLTTDIDKRGKRGFGVPIDHWFRGPLKTQVREVLLDERCIGRGFFRRAAVEKLLDEHFSSRFDHAYRIWTLFFLELWMRRWIDGA